MADNEQNTVSTAPTSPAPASVETTPTPAAPVTETIASQSPAPTEAAVTAPATTEVVTSPATTETAPATEPSAAPTETKDTAKDAIPNILGGKEEAKVEIKPDAIESDKKEIEAAAEEIKNPTPELPTYEDFTLPENFTADKEGMASFSKLLGELEASKLDHAGFQAKGQELIDLGVKTINDSINRLNDYYVQLHEKQKSDWFESLKSDPELGRNRIDTTISTVRQAVENFGGTEEQVAEFRQLMNDTGVTNNPALIRLINNMQNRINRYETESDEGGGSRMRPAARPVPTKVKPHEIFYGGSK